MIGGKVQGGERHCKWFETSLGNIDVGLAKGMRVSNKWKCTTLVDKRKKMIFEWYRLATWRNVWLSEKNKRGAKKRKRERKKRMERGKKGDIKKM